MCKESRWTIGPLLVLLAASVSTAQVASRIAGTVRDSSDAVMSGVKVTVEDVIRGVATSTVTNETGRYS
ncbi:MAG: carboxypeptidase-like regulatory domain-containing protein, partial [Bryobacteraceae bacterium]